MPLWGSKNKKAPPPERASTSSSSSSKPRPSPTTNNKKPSVVVSSSATSSGTSNNNGRHPPQHKRTSTASSSMSSAKSSASSAPAGPRNNSATNNNNNNSTTPPMTDAIRQQILQILEKGGGGSDDTQQAAAMQAVLRQCPSAASSSFVYKKAQETLLSLALLKQASLPTLQAIYDVHPAAITLGNSNSMSALHQACTVPTSFDVMTFCIAELKRAGVKVGQLTAPGGWSVLHTACRCGVLPTDTFQLVLQHSKTLLPRVTESTQSTPLHLSLYGLETRKPPDQRVLVQHLVQAYPYAVTAKNLDGNSPIEIAQYKARKGRLTPDIVDLLTDVRDLVQRKYSTRVQVEQSIAACEQTLQNLSATATPPPPPNNPDYVGSGNSGSMGSAGSGSGGSGGGGGGGGGSGEHHRSAQARKSALRQGTLAHIEREMLIPLRKKFPTEAELREIIAVKSAERARLESLGPNYFSAASKLNDEVIEYETKLQRELNALVPQEIQTTRHALTERLQAETHLPPINNVSLAYLQACTSNFDKSHRIGKGGFGSVYRAYDAVTCAQYAVKKTDKFDDPSLLREVQILAQAFHPNVIHLLGFYVPPQGRAPQYLVFEYAAGGTVADQLKTESRRQTFTWSIRLSTVAVGIASGLNYLHHGMEQTIVHHDVKPENIVFTETLDRAMLIDCGISKALKEHPNGTNFTQTMAGTPFYLPDDYTVDTPYDEKCEVFSFGMVLRVLVSGKIPKSLQDRAAPVQPDPALTNDLAWPDHVLEQFLQITEQCVAKKADDRPTLQDLHARLMALEQQAEETLKFTPQQEETIQETLTQSRQVSRASRDDLADVGTCFCSRRKPKRGLYCPSRQHFQCSECFDKYVLDHLGEQIYCRQATSGGRNRRGNNNNNWNAVCCREPYTLDELHRHVRRSVLCRHIETLMKNQELEVYKEANRRVSDQIGQGFDRVMKGMTHLARNELKCPVLALLIPAQSGAQRSIVRRALRSWKSTTTKTFFLYFLCAHDHSTVDAPIRVDARRDWVKKATPFLRAVLAGLQIAILATGIPISIPMIESAADRTEDNIADSIQVLDQMLVDAAGPDPDGVMNRDMQQVVQAMQAGSGKNGRMNSESYQLVAELANQPGNTDWREKMVLAERQGELAWVRKGNAVKWQMDRN